MAEPQTLSDVRQAIEVAVLVQREAAPNRWEDFRFSVIEVMPQEEGFGDAVRCLHDDGKVSQWLYPKFNVELHADECKGYFLNLSSGQPTWFVSWRPSESDPSQIDVSDVSVSYIEADRRLCADERVDALPLPNEISEWLRLYTNANFVPDTKLKVRAQSFLSPADRARGNKP
jgi:hypothetical protein